MIVNFIFWAQALDNSSADHIEMRGEKLGADDSVRRQEAVSLVSRVVKSGIRVFDDCGVRLTVDDQHFVVEVPFVERDSAGRMAPVVCYGDYDRSAGDALGTSVVTGIGEFATRIGRSLQPEHIELTKESFKALKKNSSMRRLVLRGAIGAVIMALLAFVRRLFQRGL